MKRASLVGGIHIYSVSDSSIVQAGDHVATQMKSTTFALQREVPYFWANEANLADDPFFNRPFPVPEPAAPVALSVDNLGSFIRVGAIRLLGLSTAAVLQIGNNRSTAGEARIKNIRQFVRPKPGPQAKTTFVKLGGGNE